MSEYKRLTYRANGVLYSHAISDTDLLRHLAELEDKIESGYLLELPCKLGDTVYKVERDYGYSNDTYFWNIVEKPFELGMLDYLWGKMIFLNLEEAEKRLKELENGRN